MIDSPKKTREYMQSYWCIVVPGLQYTPSPSVHSFIVHMFGPHESHNCNHECKLM